VVFPVPDGPDTITPAPGSDRQLSAEQRSFKRKCPVQLKSTGDVSYAVAFAWLTWTAQAECCPVQLGDFGQ